MAKVVVLGAGVIGRIYAARLSLAGHDVTLVARGAAATELAASGVRIASVGRGPETAFPAIVADAALAPPADVAIIAIRRDQIDAAAASIAALRARLVVSLTALPVGLAKVSSLVGAERFVPCFPGVGGTIADDGRIEFIEIAQQATAIQRGPGSREVQELLTSADFRTDVVPDMRSWLACHAIFVCAVESAIIAHRGDLAALTTDRTGMRMLILAIREGLRAAQAVGIAVAPASLGVIFLRMPVWFAARYWSTQLAGPLGRLAFRPHTLRSRLTEFPALEEDVRAILSGHPTPLLRDLFDSARVTAIQK